LEERVIVVAQYKFEKSSASHTEHIAQQGFMPKLNFGLGVSPRLVGGKSFDDKPALDQIQIARLADASLHSIEKTRQILRAWHRQGHLLADIYIGGIAPAARLIGERWLADQFDFVHCTIAHSRLHQILYEFSAEFLSEAYAEPNGLSLLLMSEPGSQHGLGVFMVSEFFRQAGWTVTLAAPQDIAEFKRHFHSDWFDAVALSISTERHLDAVSKALAELQVSAFNPNLQIFVGGPQASLAPDKLSWRGTHLLNVDARQAVEAVTQRMDAVSRQHGVTPVAS
jgi:methanogenic corrinoid protein MtbC1